MKIPLHNKTGDTVAYAIVDDSLSYLSERRWHMVNGYATTTVGRKPVSMHSLVLWKPKLRKFEIDHINRNRLDNTLRNLRVVSTAQNQWNASRRSDNKSGHKGVRLHYGGKWRASITANGNEINLGTYTNVEEAASAYRIAAEKYYGEYANLG